MRVAFFDVDGTLTKTRVWRGIMRYFEIRGQRRLTHWAFWAYHGMLYLMYRAGLISQTAFRAPWARDLPWFFRGYTMEAAEEIWDWVVAVYLKEYWWADSLAILRKHSEAGDEVALVSAGPAPLVKRIAEELGATHAIGTQPEVKGERYTGRTQGAVCIGGNKARLVQDYFERLGLAVDYGGSIAYADSPGDVPLLELVGEAVALHPDEELLAIAGARGWRILGVGGE